MSHARLARALLLCALLCTAVSHSTVPLDAVSTTLVIHEFSTRGPNGGNDEFIELRNISGAPISLNGWNVLGSNASGVTEVRANLSNVTLAAGCAYLLTNSNTNGYSGFVPGDQTYGVDITDDGGLALQAPGGAIVDQVGMSVGSAYGEGTRLANFGSANSSRSYQRLGADTDDNTANFRMISPAEPNNSVACAPPTGTGLATPSAVLPGANVLLTVAVIPANNPTSTGIAVVADLSSIGGLAAQPLFDTGTFGDQAASDNTFSVLTSVSGTASAGPRSLPFTITDAQSRSFSGFINLTVQGTTTTNPSGAGSTQPTPAVPVGSPLKILVGVTPGTNPTSTDLEVTLAAGSIGGLTAQPLSDLGPSDASCDDTAGDLIFTWCLTLRYDTPVGPRVLMATIRDGQGRTGTIAINVTVNAATDTDGDGLPDSWEERLGLDPGSAIGDDGPDGDPDHDGLTNLIEFRDGSHPHGVFTRYFAEGATGTFFDTQFALANPSTDARSVVVRYVRSDGVVQSSIVQLAGQRRVTVYPESELLLGDAEFSTIVEASGEVVADRTMQWDQRRYGSHAETAVASPATTWYLAEGATHSGFNLFYLLQNPTPVAANVQVAYLLPAPATQVIRTYEVPPNSRFNIWVDQIPELADTDVSAAVTSSVPIIVERAMYSNAEGVVWAAGTNALATPLTIVP